MSILSLRGVRSYPPFDAVQIDLGSYVTLIYGQNGAGKSTVSGFFYRQEDAEFHQCGLNPPLNMRQLVFNHQFIDDLFHSQEVQPGIFTLSEENATVASEISELEARASELQQALQSVQDKHKDNEAMAQTVRQRCAEQIFSSSAEIRNSAAGGLMNGAKRTDTLYQRILSSDAEAVSSTESLCESLRQLQASQGNRVEPVGYVAPFIFSEEELSLLSEPLIPAGDGVLTAAVRQLGNGDWIAQGKEWLNGNLCPFCQSTVDGDHLRREITALFDRAWENALSALRELQQRHTDWCAELNRLRSALNVCSLAGENDPACTRLSELQQRGELNENAIARKLSAPSQKVRLHRTDDEFERLHQALSDLNQRIAENNRLAENYLDERTTLTGRVFAHIRALSSEAIANQDLQLEELRRSARSLEADKAALKAEVRRVEEMLTLKYASTVNIDTTVQSINDALASLGVESFRIVRCEEGVEAYRLSRPGEPAGRSIFHSLSEGEKTLIAFLYFIETCKGRSSRDQHDSRPCLIVIDDPISSLSQNYVFEVAALIQHSLIQPRLAGKVLVLTHSLFFFQEMVLSSGGRPAGKVPPDWRLYRLAKQRYSSISLVTEKELMNDYQALWYVLRKAKDDGPSGVIIPNTMRQILEYYFSFSGKSDRLYSVLATLAREYREPRFNAFYRFINRHSHADSRNIRLQEETPAALYIEMFERVFERTGDSDHYHMMMNES
ncbi:AAA family ATPase [Duffyella gerundensis]|uniref:AAA family ATPase n=1 Tax=Duffyella gerundensis TaxID=1619313 RepID=UPI00165467CF|nr:AAA family ATPase [Duffyella gerundensis]